jgi:hypothetical protein
MRKGYLGIIQTAYLYCTLILIRKSFIPAKFIADRDPKLQQSEAIMRSLEAYYIQPSLVKFQRLMYVAIVSPCFLAMIIYSNCWVNSSGWCM